MDNQELINRVNRAKFVTFQELLSPEDLFRITKGDCNNLIKAINIRLAESGANYRIRLVYRYSLFVVVLIREGEELKELSSPLNIPKLYSFLQGYYQCIDTIKIIYF